MMTIARLRVLTLNVQNDEGGPRRIGVLNEGLRRVNADLVALQEVLRTPPAISSMSCWMAPACTAPTRPTSWPTARPGRTATAAVLLPAGGRTSWSRFSTCG